MERTRRPFVCLCGLTLVLCAVPVSGVAQEQVRQLRPALPSETPPEYSETEAPKAIELFIDALQRGYWTHPALLAERARLKGIDYRVTAARSLFGPTLGYELHYGYQRDNVEIASGSFIARSGWASTVSAILTQPIFSFGRIASAEKTAAAQVAFERATLRFTEQQVLIDAINAYVSVLRDRNGLTIASENLALLEKELVDNKARFNAHEVTSTDVQQVETRVELGRAQTLNAKRLAASSESRFLSAIGAPAGELTPPNPLTTPVQSLEEAYAFAIVHNPVIDAANAREQISRAQRDSARSEMLPRIDLRGRADYGTVTPYTDRFRQTELRAEVVVTGNLFTSGFSRSRLAEAQAINDADWRLIDKAARENKAEVADAWNEWLTQRASIDRFEAAVDSAQAAYEGALLQERAGFRTTLDVLDLARELLNAKSGYNNAKAAVFLAQARLLAAMGLLDLDYLLPDTVHFDKIKHFDHVAGKSGIPIISSALRAVDAIPTGSNSDRALRDPAAPIVTPAIPEPNAVDAGANQNWP